jgi:SAM-dependent methyltransferase
MISALVKRVRAHGVRRTLGYALEVAADRRLDWIDAGFDRRYGTDTGGIIDDMGALGVHAGRRDSARGYQGIQIPVFRRILKDLGDLGFEPPRFTFVDFGSGKGRAAMMAAERRFAAIHGVELSPVLHAVAERNLALFRDKNPAASPITLRCQDAVELDIPAGDLVCFFYNPFDAQVMARVLGNLDAAYRRAPPRRLVIVYRNPQHPDAFGAHPHLRLVRQSPEYQIYAAPLDHEPARTSVGSPGCQVRASAATDLDPASIAAWADLESRALEPNAYLSPHFVLPALRHLDPGAKALITLIEQAAGASTTLIGAAVLVPVMGTRTLPLPHLLAYQSRHSFLSGLLLDRDRAALAVGALLDWLRTQRWRWHGLEIHRAWADGAQAELIAASIHERGMARKEWDPRVRAVLTPARDIAVLEASLGSRLKDLRRRRRRLDEMGAVASALHRKDGIPEATMEGFLALEHQGWKGETKTSLRSNPADEAFFRDAVARFGQSQRVFFTELTLNGAPIASTSNFVSGNAGFAFKLGWRPDLGKMAPGILNEVELLRRLAEGACDDLVFMDSGASEGSFMEELWKGRRPLVSTTISSTPLGGTAMALTAQARSIVRRLRPARAAAEPAQN